MKATSMKTASISLVGLLAIIVALATSATAAPINYGDQPAATIIYTQVTEEALLFSDIANPPKFGAPNISGDSMDFDPVSFKASASGAAGNDVTDVRLTFGVQAKPLNVIKSITITEAGDTTLAGFGNDATFSSVSTPVFVDIFEVDGAPINQINFQINLAFAPSGGTYGQQTDGGGGPLFQTAWNGSATINFDAVLTANSIPFVSGVTRAGITLDNTLVALSQSGTTSFIAKKDADGVTITTNIPEPSTCLLAVLALAGLGRRRR